MPTPFRRDEITRALADAMRSHPKLDVRILCGADAVEEVREVLRVAGLSVKVRVVPFPGGNFSGSVAEEFFADDNLYLELGSAKGQRNPQSNVFLTYYRAHHFWDEEALMREREFAALWDYKPRMM